MPRSVPVILVMALSLSACKKDGEEDSGEIVSSTCDAAASSVALDGELSGDNTGGSTDALLSCGNAGEVDVVTFTAPAAGTYTASVDGFDTVLGVWSGCPDALEVELTCNDDGPNAPGSSASFTVGAGITVTLVVGGFNGLTGPYTLSVVEGSTVVDPVDPCTDPDMDLDGENRPECGGTDCDDNDPTVQAGTDADLDGYFLECGFQVDCDDGDDTIFPGAPDVAGDGIDQNCDGGDAFATCEVEGPRDSTTGDDLNCATGDITLRPYDVWEFTAAEGDCIDVFADNTAVGAADLLGSIEGPGGVGFFGGVGPNGFDDNTPCSVMPWNNFSCPEASLVASSAGTYRVTVAQFGEASAGCTAGAEYVLHVAVNGEAVTPTQVEDDVVPTAAR